MAQNEDISTKQRKFALACLECKDVRAAAEKAGIGERTAWRYLRDPVVLAELDRLADMALVQVAGAFMQDLAEARQVLLDVMKDNGVSAGVRVRAAKALLDAAGAFWEMFTIARRQADVEDRLAELERNNVS